MNKSRKPDFLRIRQYLTSYIMCSNYYTWYINYISVINGTLKGLIYEVKNEKPICF
jgi:hypothetical protein